MSILSSVLGQVLRFLGRRDGVDAEDFARITARFPALDALPEAAAAGGRLLGQSYQQYVSTVSTPEWAMSLQTAALLYGMCVLTKPRAVLDLGSGYSSYTLRRFARDAGHSCTIHSVDEDGAWLDRTRRYLALHDMSADGTFVLEEFRARAPGRYDVILHDMGRIALRVEALPLALSLAATEGVVVLDDINSAQYARLAREHCRQAGFDLCSVRPLTLDSIGRYAGVAFRSGG